MCHLMAIAVLTVVLLPGRATGQSETLSPDFPGKKVVVVDPGHGGHDRGAVGPSGLAEKDVTLALAKKISKILTGDHSVSLTREGDYWLDIERRTAVANHCRAHVFISLHASGSLHHGAQGVTVFCFGTEGAQGFSAEPAAPLGDGGQILAPWDQMHLRHTAQSKRLANVINRELVARLNSADRGVQAAPCLVLAGVDMPAVLVEIGYINHSANEGELKASEVITGVAEAVAQGIRAFLGQGEQSR